MEEAEITCPHCFSEITLMVDMSAGSQQYIEDCQVCCNPLEITITMEDGELLEVTADEIGQ